ncbi:MAG: hypothetical protein M3265_04450 [Actinomycetota bacterium]|nr:hypothetical protein [Actinomycetota bacterium]
MKRAVPLLIVAAGVAAAVVLFFALRPNDENAPGTAGTTTDAATTGTQETTAPTATAEPAPRRIRLVIRGEQVVGGVRRIALDQGAQVVLVVSADVSDHVHIHGYDLLAEVRPGRPARFEFEADVTGRFDIELEDRHLEIAELSVRP